MAAPYVLSQSETWSSLNTPDSQARDGAEAESTQRANFLTSTTTYTPPERSAIPSAVQLKSVWRCSRVNSDKRNDVYLSRTPLAVCQLPLLRSSNCVQCQRGGKGSFSAGNTTINYATYARLLSMTKLNSTVSGSSARFKPGKSHPTARSRVVAPQSGGFRDPGRTVVPTFGYAAFATTAL